MKHTIKGWLAMSVPDEFDDKPRVAFLGWKPTGDTYVAIREHSIEVEIDDAFDPRPAAVAALREKKTKVLADAQAEATEIERQIQTLLAIEYVQEQA
jgi:hypothetical protein